MSESPTDRHIDNVIWATIIAVGMVVALSPPVTRFRIDIETFAVPVSVSLGLVFGAWVYRHWRRDLHLACALECTAQVTLFAAVGAPLSYLAAAANFPLRDHGLDAIDKAMGFDWEAGLQFLNGHPTWYKVLTLFYGSLTLQMVAVVLCLGFSGRFAWLRVYNLAFVIAVLATIAISALLPAAGVWPHHGFSISETQPLIPAVKDSWPVFYGLRDGSFRSLVAVGSQGIITFPSLHAALAVIVTLCLWPMPRARWIAVFVSLGTLVATPIDGSHYLIDVLAGIVLAFASVGAALGIARYLQRSNFHPLVESTSFQPSVTSSQ